MQTQQIIDQIDSLIKEVDQARAASKHDDLSGGLTEDKLTKVKIRLMAAVERLAPKEVFTQKQQTLKAGLALKF